MAVDKKWFKARFADAEISQRRLASELGMEHSALSKSLSGLREFKPQEIADIADRLKLPYEDVAKHAGLDLPRDLRSMVPVVGLVDVTGKVAKGAGDGPQKVERPDKSSANLSAVRVDCPRAPLHGWLAYFEPTARLEPESVGALAVVRTVDGGQYLRVLKRGLERGRWALEAFCPGATKVPDITGVVIESAAPVLWTKAP